MSRIIHIAVLVAAVSLLGGCTSTVIDVVDAKMSQITKLECSSARLLFGDSYCAEKPAVAQQEKVHCYRTLGGVDCYRDQNPYITEKSVRVSKVLALESSPEMKISEHDRADAESDTEGNITTKALKVVMNLYLVTIIQNVWGPWCRISS